MSGECAPDALPPLLHAPSLQGRAHRQARGLSAQAGGSPAGPPPPPRSPAVTLPRFAEYQLRAAAGECRLEGLRRQFDKTQREAGTELRPPLPAYPATSPGTRSGQVEVGLEPIGSLLAGAVARTGSAAGRAAPGCPGMQPQPLVSQPLPGGQNSPSHRRGRRCRCLPAPFRRQRSGERGRARAGLRSASDPRLPRRSNRYPVHPPGRPASAPALRAGRAADRPPSLHSQRRSTLAGNRRRCCSDYPAGEWKRSADDAGPGAVPARVPARPGGGRQRRFPPVPLHAGEHARHCQRQQSTVAQACRPTGHGSRWVGVGRVEPGFAHAAPRTGSEGQALARR